MCPNKEYYDKNRTLLLKQKRDWYNKRGRKLYNIQPMNENKNCPLYLGVVVGERLCSHLFNDVQVMPFGHIGYDIICNKGKKIDVKTACIRIRENKYHDWKFNINKNILADYFIFVAFDNIDDLNPLHLWVIPGHEVNYKTTASISPSTLYKWDRWKHNLNEVKLCCTELKNNVTPSTAEMSEVAELKPVI